MTSSEKFPAGKTKNRIYIPFALLILVSCSLFYSFCKGTEKDALIMQRVVQLSEANHFSPPELDNDFSEKVFNAYLKRIDPRKQYFTRGDIAQLLPYKYEIDDQIKRNSFQLFDLAVKLYDARIAEIEGYYRELLSQPFDFTKEETFEMDADKLEWTANNTELKERWRSFFKYQALVRLSDMLKAQEKETDTSKHKTQEAREAEARERLLKSYSDVFLNLKKQKQESKFSDYLNAIVSVFDPHTMYNTPTDKENFDIRMSGQFEGIGAQLQASDGYAKVVMLLPGSPSWLQGDLKVNDLITKVRQENEQEPVDIFGMLLDDAVKLIRGKQGTRVTLTVKRSDGSIHDITITRDVVIDETTYAKSAILTDPSTGIRVGLIDLPSFYVDFKNTLTGRSSSEDVAKEIEKLKKENVQGIILDFRQNTGGSLPDAIRMAGLFIGTGPILQVKSNIGPPREYADTDPTVQYDGPLAVLVSSLSASASEIVAAALQDYQRAVIIGGPSTFGKGTVQMVVDLDEYVPINLQGMKPLGSLFLTIQKYYRINGGATQLKGVTPDIILPDLFSAYKIGERYEENCLPWTTVDPAAYTVWKNPVPVERLRKKSRERTSKNEVIQFMSEEIAVLEKQMDETKVSLNLATYQQEEKKRSKDSQRFEEMDKKLTGLQVSALLADQEFMKGDTARIALSEKWMDRLKKDVYFKEAAHIIGDMR